MIRLHWFTVHAACLVTQVALIIASMAAFALRPMNIDTDPMRVVIPWASVGLTMFGIQANYVIFGLIRKLQQPSLSSTDESRARHRRNVLIFSALIALGLTVADAAFAVKFVEGGSETLTVEYAACGVAAVASFVALAALVVDIWKIYDDISEARLADLVDQDQYGFSDSATSLL